MYVFIVNPIAGNGRAKKAFRQISESTIFTQINKEVYLTEYQGHAKKIVKELTSKKSFCIKAIIIIGGDGTIHDAINGLRKTPINIGFIPGGSGNDFARGCKIKDNPVKLLESIVQGKGEIDYWFGSYEMKGSKKRFANNIGFGFDAEVAKRANESKYKGFLSKWGLGNISYLFALLHILFSFKPKDITISYNGKKRVINDCWMITISNHPYYGGGMKIIPTAKIQSDILPVLIIHSISKWKVLILFLTVFTGQHLRFKEIELFETEKIHISSEEEVYFHADGETSKCMETTITKESGKVSIMGTLYNRTDFKQ